MQLGGHVGKFRRGTEAHRGLKEVVPMQIRHTLKRKRDEAENQIAGVSSDIKKKIEESRKQREEEGKTEGRKDKQRNRKYKSFYPSGG